MGHSGLKNRFDRSLLEVWGFWNSCMWCGKNRWDAVHHVISPSSPLFRKGDHNSSILNGAPIHNVGCHLYNSKLHDLDYEVKLLRKVMLALRHAGHELRKKDIEFIDAYYNSHYHLICSKPDLSSRPQWPRLLLC